MPKAYALGPNYNKIELTDEASQAAYVALQQAVAEREHGTDAEKALIGVLQAR